MKQRAFTLIELLVVIAIVAVLISIILPALSAAKETANVAYCTANLRELSKTATMYTADNDPSGYGAFPTQPWHLGWKYGTESVTLISEFVYGGFQAPVRDLEYAKYKTDMYEYLTEWRPYTKYMAPGAAGRAAIKNYVCPSDKSNSTPMVGESGDEPVIEDRYSSWEVNGNSYPINWYWFADPIFGNAPPFGDLEAMSACGSAMLKEKVGGMAAEFVIFMENTMNSYMYDAKPPNGSEGQSLLQKLGMGWHRKLSMYALGFYDGHVDYRFVDTRYSRGPGWNIRPGR